MVRDARRAAAFLTTRLVQRLILRSPPKAGVSKDEGCLLTITGKLFPQT
jgi:hypothetical protein